MRGRRGGPPRDVAELADDDGRSGGRFVAKALDAIAAMLADAEDELGRIDAVAGDGDHGRGMVKGSSAARAAAAEAADERRGPGLGARRRGQGVGGQGRRHLGRAVGCAAQRGGCPPR